MKTFSSISALALICFLAAGPAFSQTQINPNDDVVEAPKKSPSSDKGYSMGDFLFKPTLTITEEYNDNIYTERNNKNGDYITHVIPKASLELKNAAHELKIRAGLDQALFADDTQNHHLNYDASVSDRYKIDSTLTWSGSLGYRKRHSLPGDNDANPGADAGEPLPFNQFDANTKLVKNFGGLKLEPRLAARAYEYQNVRRVNGTIIDQGGRDRIEYTTGGRASIDIGGNYGFFFDGDYLPINYQQSSATDRDSEGGNYLAGLRYHVAKSVTVEAGLGYLHRDFDTRTYKDISTLGATIGLSWTYAPDSTLKLDYDRKTVEVTAANVGGAVRDDINMRWNHTLDDTWSLRGKLRYAQIGYEGGLGATGGAKDRQDRNYGAGIGVDYDAIENVTLSGDYNYGKTNSNNDAADYAQNLFMLGAKIGF